MDLLKKKEAIEQEKKKVKLARNAWALVMEELYFPPLEEPEYIFDYSLKKGFFIDPNNKWNITMNLANIPLFINDQDYINYFKVVMLHEAYHYLIIPYDGLTNARLLKAAAKHVPQIQAPIVVNFFSDLIIDTKLRNTHRLLIEWEFRHTFNNVLKVNNGKVSNFSNLLFKTYQKLWDLDFNLDIEQNLEETANKISKVIKKDFENESIWEQKITRISFYLKDIINTTFIFKSSKRKTNMTNLSIEYPLDILDIMGNPFEIKNSDRLKNNNEDELRQKAEELAKDSTFSEFYGSASQAGLIVDNDPLATWYRGLAKDLIKIEIFAQKPRGVNPIYPQKWKLGDPIGDLDVPLTLSSNPIIIPNITTKKWIRKDLIGLNPSKSIPDLLIVLDSSGSMKWKYNTRSDHSRGAYHSAVIASFAALHHALSKGARCNVINFAGSISTSSWTKDYSKVETEILHYQGSGTILPLNALSFACDIAREKVLIFIISDFGISNWIKAKEFLVSLVSRGHIVVCLFIGSHNKIHNKFKDMINVLDFYAIEHHRDIVDLVIDRVKKYYN
ncbi:MAG: hypothetical protein ACFFAS_17695 [Promethearchaeota archaeon]